MNAVPASHPQAQGIPLPGEADLLMGFDLHVTRMLAGTEDMSWGFIALVHAIFGTKDVDSGTRKLIGLRVVKLLNTPYHWQQHATMAKNAGLSAEVINAIAADEPVTGVSAAQSLLCRAIDELTRDAVYSDDTLTLLREHYGDVVARKLTLTIGFFNMLSRFLNGCRVPPETSRQDGRPHGALLVTFLIAEPFHGSS